MIEVGVIETTNPKYPAALKEALSTLVPSQGPKKLYYKGTFDDSLFENCLAVVGSRRLTQYGTKATHQLVTEIAAAGITIVSGFMYGGDKAAHEAALMGGGKTIAVMPCGINLIHPADQEELYHAIIEKGGLILSEYEEKTPPQNFTYVNRDRVVAGLSHATLVTEAALESGSLITASYTTQFNRKLFALPGQITSDVAKGTIHLIQQGAEAVLEAKDILKFFKTQPVARAVALATAEYNAGSPLEQNILDQLKNEPTTADDMTRLFATPAAQLSTALSIMEMKGIISQKEGTYYLT